MYRLSTLILLIVGFLPACRPTDQTTLPLADEAYFPLETGRYIVYAVTEELYSLSAPPTKATYQLKEQIGPSYTDASGQTAYQIVRFYRLNDQSVWQPDSIWSARRTRTEALRTENGQTTVRMLFPVYDQQSWDGNRYNTLGTDNFALRNIHQPFRVLTNTFARTVSVIQQDSTLLDQHKRMEVYAYDIGMVYQEITKFQYCSATPGCIGKAQIDYGSRQLYQALFYGKE